MEPTPEQFQTIINNIKSAKFNELLRQVQPQAIKSRVKFKPNDHPIPKTKPTRTKTVKTKNHQYSSGQGRPPGWSRTKTLQLVRAGNTIPQIAEIRECVESTIEGHIAELIGLGMLNLDKYIEIEDQRTIIPVVMKYRTGTLSQMKEALPPTISWGQIRMVKAFVERNITK